MENLKKLLIPLFAGGLLSISTCGKQPEQLIPESQPKTQTKVENLKANKTGIKTGFYSVDDPSIPPAVKKRFESIIQFRTKSGILCKANPMVINNEEVYSTSAHCTDSFNSLRAATNMIDTPVYFSKTSASLDSNIQKLRLLKFSKPPNNTIIYFGLPRINEKDSRKIYVGKSIGLNTNGGEFITTKESFKGVDTQGSSGSFVSDENGNLIGTLSGGFCKEVKGDLECKLLATTGIPRDKSKKAIDFREE
jgi:hypothetical protein